MVDGAHHNEGHQKQKLHEKINHYKGISLVKKWLLCMACMLGGDDSKIPS
jgi:hypothetical protein